MRIKKMNRNNNMINMNCLKIKNKMSLILQMNLFLTPKRAKKETRRKSLILFTPKKRSLASETSSTCLTKKK
jgi:hypothetical protein